jgi:hypothetical protein
MTFFHLLIGKASDNPVEYPPWLRHLAGRNPASGYGHGLPPKYTMDSEIHDKVIDFSVCFQGWCTQY